jgi:hypothetical protein
MPWLKHVPSWLPGASFKRRAKEWSKDVDDLHEAPWNIAKEKIVRLQSTLVSICSLPDSSKDQGINQTSFVSEGLAALESCRDEKEMEENLAALKGVAATMYGAGADTVSIGTVFLDATIT